jgi:tetratricopeptide (TPR) repeat protein
LDSNPDLSIRGCTALIQSGTETSAILAGAFNTRGVGYGHKHDYDRAIQDFDQVIKLKPDYADVFYNRGDAYGLQERTWKIESVTNQSTIWCLPLTFRRGLVPRPFSD